MMGWQIPPETIDRLHAAIGVGGLAGLLAEASGVGQQPAGAGPERAKHGCPNPAHSQTGATPPVNVFMTRRGKPAWKCHACAAGGDALEVLRLRNGLLFRDAAEQLAAQFGVDLQAGRPARPSGATRTRNQPEPEARPKPIRSRSNPALTLAGPEGEAHPLPQAIRNARRRAGDDRLGGGPEYPPIAEWAAERKLHPGAIRSAGVSFWRRRRGRKGDPDRPGKMEVIRIPQYDLLGRLAGAQDRPIGEPPLEEPGGQPDKKTLPTVRGLAEGISTGLDSFGAESLGRIPPAGWAAWPCAVLVEGATSMLAVRSMIIMGWPDQKPEWMPPVIGAYSTLAMRSVADAIAASGLAEWLTIFADADEGKAGKKGVGICRAEDAKAAWDAARPEHPASLLIPPTGMDIGDLVRLAGPARMLGAWNAAEAEAETAADKTARIRIPNPTEREGNPS